VVVVLVERECVARLVGRKVYFVVCRDGARAFVPAYAFKQFVERFKIRVVGGNEVLPEGKD
jgi:hypothetical protein